MVLVSCRQISARPVAVSKRKRHRVASVPVLRWSSSSRVASSATCWVVAPPVGPALMSRSLA